MRRKLKRGDRIQYDGRDWLVVGWSDTEVLLSCGWERNWVPRADLNV